jgi:hypothetical protein
MILKYMRHYFPRSAESLLDSAVGSSRDDV